MTVYLLDTNFLIYLADTDADPAKRKMVLDKMAEVLQQDDVSFVISPLISYEVLRGVNWDNPNKLGSLKNTLAQFTSLAITQEIADLARDLYRFDKFDAERNGVAKNLDKRKFDVFHYATAYVHGLEMLSHDTDISDIAKLHEKMKCWLKSKNNFQAA